MLNQINKTKDRVKRLLTRRSELRDNDNRLIAVFWGHEIGATTLENLSALDLLDKIATGQLTAGDTITRARRKVQEENEELRGVKYKARERAAEEVRQGIN